MILSRYAKQGIILLCSVTFAACSPSEEINKSFRTVNASIEESNVQTEQELPALYERVLREKTAEAAAAGKVYRVGNETLRYIDSLKAQLGAVRDDNGIKVNRLFFTSGEGERLYRRLKEVHETCRQAIKDGQDIDKLFAPLQKNRDAGKWARQMFKDVPAVAAMTLLGKFKNDCTQAMFIVLREVVTPGRR